MATVGREALTSNPVELACWNPCQDLMAVAYSSGEVALVKENLKRAWSMKKDPEKVTALAWSPDGCFLAICFSNATVTCINTMDGSEMSELKLEKHGQVVRAFWWKPGSKEHSSINVLILVFDSLVIELYANESCHLSTFHVVDKSLSSDQRHKLVDVILDETAAQMVVAYEAECSVHFVHLTLEKLLESLKTIGVLVQVSKRTERLVAGLEDSVERIGEAWQDVIAELNIKFVKLAKEKGMMSGSAETSSTIGDDMLNLLARGVTSSEFQSFLLHTLGERGAKQLCKNITIMYERIRSTAELNIQNLTNELIDALLGVKSAVKNGEIDATMFPVDALHTTVRHVAALALKGAELVQRSDQGLTEMGMFLSWLAQSICRLSKSENSNGIDMILPPEYHFNEAEDIDQLVKLISDNFFVNWTDPSGEGDLAFMKFESVGQYLKDSNLTNPASSSDWERYVASSPGLKDTLTKTSLLVARRPDTSLKQDMAIAAKAVRGLFHSAIKSSDSLIEAAFQTELKVAKVDGRLSSIWESGARAVLFSTWDPARPNQVYVYRVDIEPGSSERDSSGPFLCGTHDMSENRMKVVNVYSMESPNLQNCLIIYTRSCMDQQDGPSVPESRKTVQDRISNFIFVPVNVALTKAGLTDSVELNDSSCVVRLLMFLTIIEV